MPLRNKNTLTPAPPSNRGGTLLRGEIPPFLSLGLAIYAVWAWYTPAVRPPLTVIKMHTIRTASAMGLSAKFREYGYTWPPRKPVPRLAVENLPEDIDTLRVEAKKRLVLRTLLPIVLADNLRVMRQREFLLALYRRGTLYSNSDDGRYTVRIAKRYGVNGNLNNTAVRNELLRRVNAVPVPVALAQAAAETGWGTSRFAREGNSLYGEWTFTASAGLVPKVKAAGAAHWVRAYIHNLNVNHAYQAFRAMRTRLPPTPGKVSILGLVNTLQDYSRRGAAYTKSLQRMIVANHLPTLIAARLDPFR